MTSKCLPTCARSIVAVILFTLNGIAGAPIWLEATTIRVKNCYPSYPGVPKPKIESLPLAGLISIRPDEQICLQVSFEIPEAWRGRQLAVQFPPVWFPYTIGDNHRFFVHYGSWPQLFSGPVLMVPDSQVFDLPPVEGTLVLDITGFSATSTADDSVTALRATTPLIHPVRVGLADALHEDSRHRFGNAVRAAFPQNLLKLGIFLFGCHLLWRFATGPRLPESLYLGISFASFGLAQAISIPVVSGQLPVNSWTVMIWFYLTYHLGHLFPFVLCAALWSRWQVWILGLAAIATYFFISAVLALNSGSGHWDNLQSFFNPLLICLLPALWRLCREKQWGMLLLALAVAARCATFVPNGPDFEFMPGAYSFNLATLTTAGIAVVMLGIELRRSGKSA